MTHAPLMRFWRLAHHLTDRTATTLTDKIGLLRDCYRAEATNGPMTALAMVVLPHSVHAVWKLPKDADPKKRWNRLSSSFSRHAGLSLAWHPPWIIDLGETDIATAVAQIHAQPVQWNLTARPEDWPYSSIHHGRG